MKTRHEGQRRRRPPELSERAARLLGRGAVVSVNQQGGITAETVNITVRAPATGTVADKSFDMLRRRILYIGLRNDLPVELHALREFLITSDLMRNSNFLAFFEKWLTRTPVVVGWPGLNAFTSDELELLRQELIELKE